jgi:hypothetical protein
LGARGLLGQAISSAPPASDISPMFPRDTPKSKASGQLMTSATKIDMLIQVKNFMVFPALVIC